MRLCIGCASFNVNIRLTPRRSADRVVHKQHGVTGEENSTATIAIQGENAREPERACEPFLPNSAASQMNRSGNSTTMTMQNDRFIPNRGGTDIENAGLLEQLNTGGSVRASSQLTPPSRHCDCSCSFTSTRKQCFAGISM